MTEYVKCNLCDSDFYDILYPSTLKKDDILRPDDLACTNRGHGFHHRIIRCKVCGLIYSNPRDDSGFLENFYRQVKDLPYDMVSAARKKTFKRTLLHLEKYKYKEGMKLLDIGCYTGLFMNMARLRGWNVFGVEPSQWASNVGRETNKLMIANSTIFEVNKIADKFDVITMWDVLEHLSNPCLALKICHERLLADGIIAISTMRCQGLFYSLCGSRWPWFMRMHLYYFTIHTMTKMLEQTGFHIIHVRPYTHDTSLDYLFYKFIVLGDRFSSFLRNSVFRNIILPVQLGDFMEVYAKKSNA